MWSKNQIYTDIIIGYTTQVTLQICEGRTDILINVTEMMIYPDGEKMDSTSHHTKKLIPGGLKDLNMKAKV